MDDDYAGGPEFYEETVEETVTEIERKRSAQGFNCKRCGRCCLSTDHVDLCKKDIEGWERAGRRDLIDQKMLKEWEHFGSTGLFNNRTSRRCPFIRKVRNKNEHYCTIYDVRPLFCRIFPVEKGHGEFCRCEGYDGKTGKGGWEWGSNL